LSAVFFSRSLRSVSPMGITFWANVSPAFFSISSCFSRPQRPPLCGRSSHFTTNRPSFNFFWRLFTLTPFPLPRHFRQLSCRGHLLSPFIGGHKSTTPLLFKSLMHSFFFLLPPPTLTARPNLKKVWSLQSMFLGSPASRQRFPQIFP